MLLTYFILLLALLILQLVLLILLLVLLQLLLVICVLPGSILLDLYVLLTFYGPLLLLGGLLLALSFTLLILLRLLIDTLLLLLLLAKLGIVLVGLSSEAAACGVDLAKCGLRATVGLGVLGEDGDCGASAVCGEELLLVRLCVAHTLDLSLHGRGATLVVDGELRWAGLRAPSTRAAVVADAGNVGVDDSDVALIHVADVDDVYALHGAVVEKAATVPVAAFIA